MTTNYSLVNFHLSAMIQMLMRKYSISYEEALPLAMSSNTYKRLLDQPYLQEEGSLFVCELLEKELGEQRAETPAEA